MKKQRFFYLYSAITVLVFLLLQFYDPPVVRDILEGKTFDLRLRLRNILNEQPKRNDIVIVAIDEKSLAETGRWPWSRSLIADLVSKISQQKPKVIGVDIMFTEPEANAPDRALGTAIERAGNVVLASAFILSEKEVKGLARKESPDFLWDSAFMEVRSVPGIAWKSWAVRPERVLPPLKEIAYGARLGHVTSPPDLDGVVRWEILSLNFGDDCYPSLPLLVATLANETPQNELVLLGGSCVLVGKLPIKTDLSGRVLINYRGKEGTFPYVSASDILAGVIPPETLRNKIVLIGGTALATYDQKVTPLSANMPGIEKNANVVQNVLENNFITKSPGVVEITSILFFGLLLVIVLPRLTARRGVYFSFGMIAVYGALACGMLIYGDVWCNLVYPVSCMAMITTAETIGKLFFEEKRAREIRAMFSSYVSPKIVEVLINNPEKAALGGQRRNVTILFSDIIGFTSLSEKLTPEEVVSMLNEYYREMAEVIFYWDGTLDKFVGDEIMAIWGAPADQPDHAMKALRCAFHMSDKLERLQEKWRESGWHNIDCGIGINTGDAVIGNIGITGKKMDYTAIGSNVNIAARVEKLNRQYGSRILITGNTFDVLKPLIDKGAFGHSEMKELDPVSVRGLEEVVRVFHVQSRRSENDQIV